uniref:Uncharacterized protein n=1 Tax=Arundo donax TaxID=35708 RepID=A0A0A9CRB9_ARUDO
MERSENWPIKGANYKETTQAHHAYELATLGGVDVDADGDNEDGEEAEEDDGVDEDGDGAGGHVAELHHPRPRGQLEQQPRRQHHKQDHRHDDGAPVRARPRRRVAVHVSLPPYCTLDLT